MPTWLQYLDQAYLSAKFGHTLRDLKQPNTAEEFARQSLRMTDGYERGRIFNLALLAGVLPDNEKREESVSIAEDALQMTTRLKPKRAVAYLGDVAQRLTPFSDDNRVRALYKRMTNRNIPLCQSI